MRNKRRQFFKLAVTGFAILSSGSILRGRSPQNKLGTPLSKPWLEISKQAYLHNASQINKMAKGKPILAVLKNNAYGIGAVEVAKILEHSPFVSGIAVVKDQQALAIRLAGVSKPILLMGDFDLGLSSELIKGDITLSVYSKAALEKIAKIAITASNPVKVALYIDTGLGRMGIPLQEALTIARQTAKVPSLQITQTFSTLTTPEDFAKAQIDRFQTLTWQLEKEGIQTGSKHLAPSHSLLNLPTSWQDQVRPGILLHGSFPGEDMPQAKSFPLKIPFRLKAAIIRLEMLRPGDTIGFSRFYKVEKNEWIATLPIGWADGYDSGAENGAKVLIGNRLFPVVNVNASHTNISLGEATDVQIGDVATLIGPEHPEITPEGFGKLINRHNYLQIQYKESIPKRVYEAF